LGLVRPDTAGFGPTNGPTARSARDIGRRRVASRPPCPIGDKRAARPRPAAPCFGEGIRHVSVGSWRPMIAGSPPPSRRRSPSTARSGSSTDFDEYEMVPSGRTRNSACTIRPRWSERRLSPTRAGRVPPSSSWACYGPDRHARFARRARHGQALGHREQQRLTVHPPVDLVRGRHDTQQSARGDAPAREHVEQRLFRRAGGHRDCSSSTSFGHVGPRLDECGLLPVARAGRGG
jgi:hypothetical protein